MLDHFLIAHRALEETVEVPATETRKTVYIYTCVSIS